MIAIQTTVVKMASQLGIGLIHGEDGEVEYGGTTETAAIYDTEYMKKFTEAGYDKVISSSGLSEGELFFNF